MDRVLAASALLGLAALILAHPVIAASQACGDYYFIIYGQDWCPHCRNMEDFVKNTYGQDCLEFRDLDNATWNRWFVIVVQTLNNKYGVPTAAAFPLTGVLYKGELRAIIQGEITDRGFIEDLVSRAVEEGDGWVAVYTGAGGFLVKADSNLTQAYTPVNGVASSAGESGGPPMIPLLVVGIIAAGAIAAVFIRRR